MRGAACGFQGFRARAVCGGALRAPLSAGVVSPLRATEERLRTAGERGLTWRGQTRPAVSSGSPGKPWRLSRRAGQVTADGLFLYEPERGAPGPAGSRRCTRGREGRLGSAQVTSASGRMAECLARLGRSRHGAATPGPAPCRGGRTVTDRTAETLAGRLSRQR